MPLLHKSLAIFFAILPSLSKAENVIRINAPIIAAGGKPTAPAPVRTSYVGRTFSYTIDKTNWFGPNFSFDYDADTETLTVKTMPGSASVKLSDGRMITPPNKTIHLNKTDVIYVSSVFFNLRPELQDTVYCFRPIGNESYPDIQDSCSKISSLNYRL